MGPTAHVTETEALVHFRATLGVFAHQAGDALTTIAEDIRRTFSFLDEQLHRWTAAVRQAEDDVIQAKNELARKKMMRIGDRKLDTTDQEKALRRAQARLEHAQEKLDAARRWLRELPDELTNYEGPSRQLQAVLETDVPRMVATLDRKIASLEEYLRQSQ